MRAIAIDWSGAHTGAEKKIWLAEAIENRLVRLENGRSREQAADYLVAEARRDPQMIVGFDFAFSLPAWFLEERALENARELWSLADREAEGWLARCESPFWGRPGKSRPLLGPERDHFRRTDTSVPNTGGIRPKSVFQIGGAGAVGTGSLRGMPILHRLTTAGFSVWPFDPPGWPLIIEIYPRLLTGPVNKSNAAARSTAPCAYAWLLAKMPSTLRSRHWSCQRTSPTSPVYPPPWTGRPCSKARSSIHRGARRQPAFEENAMTSLALLQLEVLRRMREEAPRPGHSLTDAFANYQRYYAEAGFSDEWRLHHQGGMAAYASREVIATPEISREVRRGQAFVCNPSIIGAKSEETFVLTGNRPEVICP